MKHAFKTIGSIAAMSAIMIMAASCAKDTLSEETQEMYYAKGELRHISVSTVMPSANTNDKAFVDGSSYVQWVEGDLLNINGTKLPAEEVRGAHNDTASFKGDVYAIPSGGNDIYWSVYPANKIGEYTNAIPSDVKATTLDVTFPKTYNYSAAQLNQHLTGLNLMVCRSEVAKGAELKKIAMKNVGSIMRINMTAASGVSQNKNVQKIILSSCDGNIAGKYRINSSYAVSTISGQTYTNTVTVTFSTPVDITSQKSVCVMLPPTLNNNCLNVTLVNTDGAIYHLATTSAKLERNKYYTANMTSVDFSTEAYDNKLNNTTYYFKVGSSRNVVFSPGNLQYNAATTVGGTHFRFAPNQWDYVGTSCKYGTVYNTLGDKSKNESISSSYNGWIDLFGWGTSGYNSKNPYMTSTTNSDYGNGKNDIAGTHYDWGVHNKIFNPKTNVADAANTWRLMTGDEVEYLLDTRTTGKTINGTANARYTMATIRTDAQGGSKNVHGLILFPDNYNGGGTVSGVTWGKINTHSSSWNTKCTKAGWTALEQHGCVFIPASGWRSGTTIGSCGNDPNADHPYQVYCWSSSDVDGEHSGSYAEHLLANKNEVKKAVGPARKNGYGVRLVKNK
ncbi:MAG: hypothetical protein IJQ89_03590 [Bacteroidales bacterium]|nr:hypothetical protein [Bacteroidales bacterium]